MELIYPPYTAPIVPRPKADSPTPTDDTPQEMLPVVEENGLVVGQMTRSYAHSGSMEIHPVVHLHIINRNGQFYLQRRGKDKKLLPLKWDTAVGGHIEYGEFVMEALYRESWEELKLSDFNPIPLEAYTYTSPTEKEIVIPFICIYDGEIEPVKPEVEDGRWWTIKEIKDNLGKSVFTPNFESEFPRIEHLPEKLL